MIWNRYLYFQGCHQPCVCVLNCEREKSYEVAKQNEWFEGQNQTPDMNSVEKSVKKDKDKSFSFVLLPKKRKKAGLDFL